MADREVHTHTSSGGAGVGVLGVVVGAALVIGVIVFFAGGTKMFSSGGAGPSVTINAPSAPNTSGAAAK